MKPIHHGVRYMALVALILVNIGTAVSGFTPAEPGQLAIIEPLLLVSTLDGGIYAVGQRSGLIKWTLQEEPIVRLPQLPNMTENLKQPLFLPDPKDGSLYIYNGISSKAGAKEGDDDAGARDALQKMPFTISELVSASPCRSSDGLLYTGRKVDTWITINAKTGVREEVLNSDSPMCPKKESEEEDIKSEDSLFLGKSEYHLSIFDLKTREKRWNITLIDYSASATLAIPQKSYELLHLTSSSSGRIVTIDLSGDQEKQRLLWSLQLGSPIVAIYQFNEGIAGQTRRVPFTTVGDPMSRPFGEALDTLFPSLYIGESESTKSAYALSALVDLKETRIMSSKQRVAMLPLLEGPAPMGKGGGKSTIHEYFHFLLYGYYEFPDFSTADYSTQVALSQVPSNLITGRPREPLKIIQQANRSDSLHDDVQEGFGELLPLIIFALLSVSSSVGFGFWFHFKRGPSLGNSKNGSHVSIGKITYDTKSIIGRGSSGTCVYKGRFEGKQLIAVKRVITDYLVVADREIELLRTLQHPNLVRYFATESDELFRYIAIELAELSLADYVEGRAADDVVLNPSEILYDSCLGLAHLHSVNVIHRDIKPQNILISTKLPPLGRRKVLISDFGVSKELTHETSITSEYISTTRVIKGTEGWIAPEVLKSKLDQVKDFKAAKPIDIFSMGCLFYYVYTKGKHPFGDSLERQTNILRGQYDLSALNDDEENIGRCSVIELMIAASPDERPTIETVVQHPIFWSAAKQLRFFQDLSDRIEKEPYDSEIVGNLERGGFDVVKGDWKRYIPVELQGELKKHRSYRGNSVRELLRALRNKRHHYRELSEEIQAALGAIPDEFVVYFTSRFPRLLFHAYIAMQPYKFEPIFRSYYNQESSWDFAFPQLPRTGIRWFELNGSPKKKSTGPKTGNSSGELDVDPLAEDDTPEISLKPNGFAGQASWRSAMKSSSPVFPRKAEGARNPSMSPPRFRPKEPPSSWAAAVGPKKE